MSGGTTLIRRGDGAVACGSCRVADTFLARLLGLAGRRALAAGEGLLLPRTRSVHTHFMRFPLDVVFLDADGRVVRVAEAVRPWRGAGDRRARSVLELAAGEARRRGLRVGDVLEPARA